MTTSGVGFADLLIIIGFVSKIFAAELILSNCVELNLLNEQKRLGISSQSLANTHLFFFSEGYENRTSGRDNIGHI